MPTLALACRTDRHLSGAALRRFLQSEKLLQQIWLLCGVRDTDCAVGKCAEKPGGSWVPVFAHEQLWIASCFSIVPMCSFLSMVLTWEKKRCSSNWVGFICPKNTAVSHHNVHLLWQLVHPSPAIMCMNYLPFPVPGSHWLFSPFTKG